MSEIVDLLFARHDGPAYPYSSHQERAILLVVIPTAVAVVICALRIYSRVITKSFGTDDWLMCAATFFTINLCWAANLFIHDAYVGVHTWDVPPHAPNREWLWNWLGQLFYTPILALVKISILVFLLRLGGKERKCVRIAIDALIIFSALQLVAILLVTIFQCRPVRLAYTSLYPEGLSMGRCLALGPFTMAAGSLNVLTDILVLIFPFRIFLDLKINTKVRNALIGVFMMGMSVPVASILRLYLFYRHFYVTSSDPNYTIRYVISPLESNLAIIAASLPPLWPLARRWFPGMDERLGINRPHQADIEVQPTEDSGDTSVACASPPKVTIRWTRTDTVRRGRRHVDSPDLAGARRDGSAVGRMSAEGNSRDGLMLAPSPFALPSSHFASALPSAQERQGDGQDTEEKQPADYFSNFHSSTDSSTLTGMLPDRYSYHRMLAGSGQRSPFGNHGNTLDNPAVYSEKCAQLECQKAAFSLPATPRPGQKPTMPPRALSTPAGFKLTLPPHRKKIKAVARPPTMEPVLDEDS